MTVRFKLGDKYMFRWYCAANSYITSLQSIFDVTYITFFFFSFTEQNEHARNHNKSCEGNEHYANADAWTFGRIPNRSI